jgi:glycosyltransferase involved in cell wall biosynthesis
MSLSSKGFNLIGYATSPMGLGEDLRSFAAMLNYLAIPFSVTDIPTDVQGQVSVKWQYLTTKDYETTVFFMSPMECQKLALAHPQLFSQPQRKVGYFLWELPDFPNSYTPALKLVDHIWCPTRFVQKTFFAQSRQLTLVLPLPVVQHPATGRKFRKEHQVPPKAFVCLFMFDLHSTVARKNPHAVLRVFLEFAATHPTAYLFLKISRWQNMGEKALAWIPQHPRIKIVKDTLQPSELTDLYQSANCYLSLHRSEGFGRTLVEALQNGLHVVSTDFSGPEDFLNKNNAQLVSWKRITVEPQEYPYLNMPSWWADPDESSALEQLHEAFRRAKKGPNTQGQSDGEKFSYAALASKYKPILNTYLNSIN